MPKALDNAMHLYTLSLSPYTFSEEEIEIEQVDNRRYTTVSYTHLTLPTINWV